MRVTLWGTRGSIPVSGPRFVRHGGSTTCLSIDFDRPETKCGPTRIVIDCGTGIAELGKVRGGFEDTLVLQTHLHWDHVQGFPFFGPLFDRTACFRFFARERDGESMRDVLDAQMSRPTFPVGLEVLPAQLAFESIDAAGSSSLGESRVSWAEMDHPSGSTAFRVDADGASFVFSGDVEAACGCSDALVELARSADLLVMDSQYFPDEYATRRGWGHSTPLDAVEIAVAAGVSRLVMTHHDPTHDDERLEAKLALARQHAAGSGLLVDNAYDRMTIELRQSTQAAAA